MALGLTPDILYPQSMLFPGFAGVATAVGLFVLIWLIVYLRTKSQPVIFDPGSKHGEFGKRLLPMTSTSQNLSWDWPLDRLSSWSAR